MKILFVGDTHGSITQWDHIVFEAKKQQADLIWQVGDFGYHFTPEYIQRVHRATEETGVPVYWIDGNHDDHTFIQDRLKELFPNCPYCDGNGLRNLGSDGTCSYYESCHKCDGYGQNFPYPAEVALWDDAPNVFYMPRGSTTKLGGLTFMAMGGAFSIDKDVRTPYVSWWPEETISAKDVECALEVSHVDVIVSHDVPYGVSALESMIAQFPLSDRLEQGSAKNRIALLAIVEQLRPKLVVHGHYHWHYKSNLLLDDHQVSIVGLDCTGGGQLWLLEIYK